MEKLVEALETAQEIERLGREYYLDSARRVKDPIVKSVLIALADDEESHQRLIDRYYKALQDSKGWPTPDDEEVELPQTALRFLRHSIGEIGPDASFLEVYVRACELERESRDFYLGQAAIETDRSVVEFLKFLARIEQIHIDTLEGILEATRGAVGPGVCASGCKP